MSAIALQPRDLLGALRVAAAVLALVVVAAGVTAAAFAARARDALGFGFGGIPPRLDAAAEIFTSNIRLMGAIAAAAIVVQSLWYERDGAPLTFAGRAVRAGLDLMLGIAVVQNAILVGVALGAYDARMVRAMVPHAPVELAAFAVALALYVRARGGRLEPAPAALLAGWAVTLLALAALLETFVAL